MRDYLESSLERWAAANTAFIKDDLTPPFSSSWIPAIVVPANTQGIVYSQAKGWLRPTTFRMTTDQLHKLTDTQLALPPGLFSIYAIYYDAQLPSCTYMPALMKHDLTYLLVMRPSLSALLDVYWFAIPSLRLLLPSAPLMTKQYPVATQLQLPHLLAPR
jgi:hypothetical protein